MLVLKFIAIALLVRIAYEDLKARMVHSWLFIALAAAVCTTGIIAGGALDWLRTTTWNLLFVGLMLGGTAIYFLFRHGGEWTTTMRGAIGAGDVALLGILCIGFTTFGFALFIIAALCFAVVAHFIARWLLRTTETTVALAGWLSICWALLLVDQLTIGTTHELFGAY